MARTQAEKNERARELYAQSKTRKDYIIASNRRRRVQIRERIRAMKVERGCDECGFSKCAEALEFHHRPGEKKSFNIGGKSVDLGWETILAEIAKCDVLCANCHRMKRCKCCNI